MHPPLLRAEASGDLAAVQRGEERTDRAPFVCVDLAGVPAVLAEVLGGPGPFRIHFYRSADFLFLGWRGAPAPHPRHPAGIYDGRACAEDCGDERGGAG